MLFVLLLAAAAEDQSLHFGKCPRPPVQQDFNVAKYMRTWYEIEKHPALFEKGTCNQATYSLLSDGTVKVLNAELLSNGKMNSIKGVAKVKHSTQPAILDVSFFKVSDQAGCERSKAKINERPIIGILAQNSRYLPPNSTGYIASAYVKFLESGGARVVPIMDNQGAEEYKRLFNSINGYRSFSPVEANKRGDYFPVWGTCLGYEQLTVLTSGEKLLTRTNTSGVSLPLLFTKAYDYPIYGTQWHPEKNAFQWRRPCISHSPSAVMTTFYMAQFFVNEARKNFHTFESEKEERSALIYNYNPVHSPPNSDFEQKYIF
ncbi:hypothetical protein KUCAC02_017755 [Chaenocephalus aceratus]|uniref:Uncharacterized protein n=1 Tax=Chaenocephalus aceratus TaxID=36190 RepID=A0ACB9W357_CHAAC|nr:hypothetical protein KUCAC02_017755 [Chaenocephalus aceratus]